jgi:hypothetical protein
MSGTNAAAAATLVFPSKFSKTPSAPRQFMTQDEINKFESKAAIIRHIKKSFPDASNGEIARFMGIRPQWVFNVLANPPKKG